MPDGCASFLFHHLGLWIHWNTVRCENMWRQPKRQLLIRKPAIKSGHDVLQVHWCTVKTKLVITYSTSKTKCLSSMNKVTIHKSIQSIQTVSRSIKWSSYGLCKHSQLPNRDLLDFFFWSLHLGNVLKFKDMTDMTIWNTGQIINVSHRWVWFLWYGMWSTKNTFDSTVKCSR